jgi:hypothetical protein
MLRSWATLGLLVLGLMPASVRADAFDNYTNVILTKIPESKSAKKVAKLTPALMVEHNRTLPNTTATFIVVKTNEGRFAKLLVLPARQKLNDEDSVPIILVERFVTYRDGEERTVEVKGQDVRLFGDFRFSLDIGQVVPNKMAADLRVIVDKDDFHLEPVGKAEIYLVTKHLPEANPAKPAKLVVGAQFETRYFNGVYQLHDDGRRSGELHLKVADNGIVTGFYYSDKDGQKYEVNGKVSNNPQHQITFDITYPRTSQNFVGYLFTGDGRAITGYSRLQGQGREAGFYALRVEK